MSMKPGDTYLIEGKIMMVVTREIQGVFYLVQLVGSVLVGPPKSKGQMTEYLEPFTKLSRGI